MQRSKLLLLLLLSSCSLVVGGRLPTPCGESNGPPLPRCEENDLVTCAADGFEVSLDCGGSVCHSENGGSCGLCGDGSVDPGEACDDGNTQSGDGCRADCDGKEECGDGLQDQGEACDDGNTTSGDGCRADCGGAEICGDNFTDTSTGEECDNGNQNNNNSACTLSCEDNICGDGHQLFGDEGCDDGNLLNSDGCDATCQVEPGFICSGDPSSCEVACGNGVEDPGEECDDGNNVDADGCEADCTNPACDNQILDPGEVCYATQAPISLGGNDPSAVISVDLNGDGQKDLITANQSSNNISIFLNQQGAFSSVELFPVGVSPRDIAAIDIDNDSDQDLVTANLGDVSSTIDGDVSVLTNNEGILSLSSFAVLGRPTGVLLSDLDGDALPEIITGSPNVAQITILKNKGANNFDPGFALIVNPANGNGEQLVVGDFTGDPLPDIATNIDNQGFIVFKNNGNLSFTQGQPLLLLEGVTVQGLVAGDLKGNGAKLDLSFVSQSLDESSTLFTLLNDESGDFIIDTQLIAIDASEVLVSDFSGDALADVAVAGTQGGLVGVFKNTGAGVLSVPQSFFVTGFGALTFADDVSGDGRADLVRLGFNEILLILNKGLPAALEPEFIAEEAFILGLIPQTLTTGDLDGDQDTDIITFSGDSVGFLQNDGAGTFFLTETPFIDSISNFDVFASPLALSDLEQDSLLDVVIGGGNSGEIFVLHNIGGGQLEAPLAFSSGSDLCCQIPILAKDLTGDALPDIVNASFIGTNGISILVNQSSAGNLQFAAASFLSTGFNVSSIAGADLDGDADIDLILAGQISLAILINSGTGSFTTTLLPDAANSAFVGAANFDGDGDLDLFTSSADNKVSLFVNDGSATFAPPVQLGDLAAGILSAADLNGDSLLDIVSPRGTFLLNQGNNVFSAPNVALATLGFTEVAVGELTGDGEPDLALIRRQGESPFVVVIPNEGGNFDIPIQRLPDTDVKGITDAELADLDGDAVLDLITVNPSSNNMAIFAGQGDGDFVFSALIQTLARSLAVGDFDGDTLLDVATISFSPATINVFYNQGGGVLGAPVSFTPDGLPDETLVAVDFDEDGDLDLALLVDNGGGVDILLNDGSGIFTAEPKVSFNNFNESAYLLVVGDFAGDSAPDVVVLGENFLISLPNNGGVLTPQPRLNLSFTPFRAVAASFDDDNKADVMVTPDSPNVQIAFFSPNNNLFQQPVGIGGGGNYFGDLLALDIDRDSDQDFFAFRSGSLTAFFNEGNQIFTEDFFFSADLEGDFFAFFVSGDVNNDGLFDATLLSFSSQASILLSSP